MNEILQGILKWCWGIVTNAKALVEWLFLPLSDNPSALAQTLSELLSYIGLQDIAPIGLVGIGAGVGGAVAIIIGIVRAIA